MSRPAVPAPPAEIGGRRARLSARRAMLLAAALLRGAAGTDNSNATESAAAADTAGPSTLALLLPEVTVTARRLDLLGTATSASEGVVADEELHLAPIYRPGQLLETVPGLIVTLHGGENP